MVDMEHEVPFERMRLFRRDEYERMAELGIFENERVELLRGVVVKMTPQSGPRMGAIRLLNERLIVALRGRAGLNPQGPFVIGDHSVPEPDIALIPPDTPREQHATEAYLVIEVAATSLSHDRSKKGPLYAEAGVPEYWIVNLVDRVIEVHRNPTASGYVDVEMRGPGETVSPLAFPDIAIDVAEIVGS